MYIGEDQINQGYPGKRAAPGGEALLRGFWKTADVTIITIVVYSLVSVKGPENATTYQCTSSASSYRRCRAGRTSTLQVRLCCCPRRARRSSWLEGRVLRRTRKHMCRRTRTSLPGPLLGSSSCKGARCRGCKFHKVPFGNGRDETEVGGGGALDIHYRLLGWLRTDFYLDQIIL